MKLLFLVLRHAAKAWKMQPREWVAAKNPIRHHIRREFPHSMMVQPAPHTKLLTLPSHLRQFLASIPENGAKPERPVHVGFLAQRSLDRAAKSSGREVKTNLPLNFTGEHAFDRTNAEPSALRRCNLWTAAFNPMQR
jgi:hypothetical protein